MDPNLPQEESSSSFGKILVIGSIIVIISLAGFFFYKSVTNREVKQNNTKTVTVKPNIASKSSEVSSDSDPIICKVFSDLELALETPEIACVLDLSNQNLTEVPAELYTLTNIAELDLSNNNLSEFPVALLGLETLRSLNLNNNKIVNLPEEIMDSTTLQTISVEGNPIKAKLKENPQLPTNDGGSISFPLIKY